MNPKQVWEKHFKTTFRLALPKDLEKAVIYGYKDGLGERDVFVRRDGQEAYIGRVEKNINERWEPKTTEDDRYRHGFPQEHDSEWDAAGELLRVYNQGWWEEWLKEKSAWAMAH